MVGITRSKVIQNNYLIIFQNCSGKFAKIVLQSGSTKLFCNPQSCGSSKLLFKVPFKIIPQSCSPNLLHKVAPLSSSPKRFPAAASQRYSPKYRRKATAPKLIPKMAPQSYTPKRLPKAAPQNYILFQIEFKVIQRPTDR